MKVLIASDTYYPDVNGASYFTQRLASMLAKRGHQVFVIAPSRKFKDSVYTRDDVTVHGIRSIAIFVYPDFRICPLFLTQKSIEKHIKDISPDIIHIQNHFMIGKGVMKVAEKLNIPVVGTNHFMPENLVHYFHLPKFAEQKLKDFGWQQFMRVFSRVDTVTTPTKTAAALIKGLGFKKEVIPISCGIDLKRFNLKHNGEHLKKRYKIPTNKLVMLYVGRLEKEKRIEVIIRALPQILKNVDAHLVLAGTGKLKTELEAQVKKMGIQNSVTFTGFVPDADLQDLYHTADLFVIAGIAELQSLVTMEAMASGLPIVAVNAMALPELVHDGENGYLFPDGNSKILAERAVKILSNKKLRDQMAQKSLEIIHAHDADKIADRYEAIYKETIAEHFSG